MATKPSAVKTGDLMAFTYYGKVQQVRSGGKDLDVVDVDSKNEFNVRGDELVKKTYSADRFDTTKGVSKTEAAEILVRSFNKPFTVKFQKSDGTNRTLRGRLIQPEPLLGRSMAEDLDVAKGSPLRQIDHRTLQELVVDGVRYVVR